MALRVLVVLAAFAVLCSCEQASSPVEKQEKEHGAEQVGGGEEKKGATGGTQNGESLKEAIRSDLEKVGEMQSESKSVDLEIHNRGPGQSKNMTFATVDLKMGEGELNVTGGADADRLMEADFSYNVSAWKPKVSKHVPGEWGLLTVRQGSVEGARGGDARNEWDIRLNDEVHTHLVVEVGAGESDLDLDSLNLGIPGPRLRPGDLTVQMGAGDITVDLTGDYTKKKNIYASIQGGVGEATVLLPSRVGVKVKAQGLGKINAEDLQRVDDAYVNDAYGESEVTLRVDIEGGFREINLEVV
jgi:N-terminal domain of toast_rack, DUF2154/Cell wall-active antibiotics response 4TMS YvqF